MCTMRGTAGRQLTVDTRDEAGLPDFITPGIFQMLWSLATTNCGVQNPHTFKE